MFEGFLAAETAVAGGVISMKLTVLTTSKRCCIAPVDVLQYAPIHYTASRHAHQCPRIVQKQLGNGELNGHGTKGRAVESKHAWGMWCPEGDLLNFTVRRGSAPPPHF